MRAAWRAGLDESRLTALLRRRAGLMRGGRLLDLLFEGKAERVIAEIQAAA